MIRALMTLTWLLLAASGARAQSSDDIIKALDPTAIQPVPGFRKPIFGAPGGQPRDRGITVEGEPEPMPSIDLQIPFEYNSDKLTPDAILILRRLGTALKDQRLAHYRFRLAGHTDARGSTDYNQKLSERRAAAVRDYLIFQYDIEGARIDAAGFGKQHLADPSRPEDGVNRRVQVINIGRTEARP